MLQVDDVASVGSDLAVGLRARGHVVRQIQTLAVGSARSPFAHRVLYPLRVLDWWRWGRRIRSAGYDVVHIHFASHGLIGILGAFPYWLHCHGSDVRENLSVPVLRRVTTAALNRAVGVLYSTPDLRARVLRIRPDAEFLPNPIDVSRFDRERAYRKTRRIFVFLRLDAGKGAADALKGAAHFASSDVEVVALKWGERAGALEREYSGRVTFVPKVPRDEVPGLLAEADIVVGQLRSGALGLSELEALASGAPLVARFDFPNAYTSAPPVHRAETAADVVGCLGILLDRDRDSLRVLGRAGRRWVAEEHGIAAVASKLESLYQQRR